MLKDVVVKWYTVFISDYGESNTLGIETRIDFDAADWRWGQTDGEVIEYDLPEEFYREFVILKSHQLDADFQERVKEFFIKYKLWLRLHRS